MDETPNKTSTKPDANHQAAVENVASHQPALSLETLSNLLFDFYKHLTTISLISAGGLITLLQAGMVEPDDHRKLMVSAAFLFGSAILAFFTGFTWLQQCANWHYFPEKYQAEVEAMRSKKKRLSALTLMTMAAIFLFGMGIGKASSIFFK